MSLQWTIAAGMLYLEIGIVLLLVLPIATPSRWQKIFRSRFLQILGNQVYFYFYILLFVMILFLMDAIREIRKYSGNNQAPKTVVTGFEMQESMKLFRAQRNFYISGMTLFLSFVIKRLVTLISTLATVSAQSEALHRQAKNATTMAKSLITGEGKQGEEKQREVSSSDVEKLKLRITDLEKELEKERNDKEAMMKQADSVYKEYDRLSEEFVKLEKKSAIESSGDKKDM